MIKFSGTEFNLGVVKYKEFVKTVIDVTNLYNFSVKLEPANSSCSCTTGVVKDAILQPNGKTQFTITLSTEKAGVGSGQVKSIALNYVVNGVRHSQMFRIKVNIV